jgi:surface antigen
MKTGLQGRLERSVVGVARRTAVLLAVLTTSLIGFNLASAATARADGGATAGAVGGELCDGYAACSTDGFTTNGYPANAKTSWWRMYPGDNCTNYVAYVESQTFGVTEPTYLLGDAYQWAENAAANGVPVNDTPSVGAVAFWGPGTLGMKRYGHVAIVQAVGPDGSYIDVSQSGMGVSDNGYDWQRIYLNSTSWEPWPASFIHFAGTNIPQPQTPAQPVQALAPVSWPQVMLTQLSWGPGSIGISDAVIQLPTFGAAVQLPNFGSDASEGGVL